MPIGNKNNKIAGLGTHHIAVQTAGLRSLSQPFTPR